MRLDQNKKKLILLISILVITVSFSYAYFAPLIGGGASTNLKASTGITDDLYFDTGSPIEMVISQENLVKDGEDVVVETTVSANLKANNDSNNALESYNIYLNIKKNEFTYLDGDDAGGYPELILNIYDPNGNEVTEFNGLAYCVDCMWESGYYDLTTIDGMIPIILKYDIESNSNDYYTVQEWKFVFTYVNGSWNQNGNAGKKFETEIKMEHVDPMAPVMAIYSEDDESLRFYNYDESAVVGETYNNLTVTDLYTGIEYANYNVKYSINDVEPHNNIPWFDRRESIKKVIVEDSIEVANLRYFFSLLVYTTYFDVSKMDTSNIRDMGFVFYKSGDYEEELVFSSLENWDVSNVENMASMFQEFSGENIFEFNIPSTWNTSNVTDMSFLFTGNFSLTGLENLDTSSVTDMSSMFAGYGSGLTDVTLSLSGWDTSRVTNMSEMFSHVGGDSATTINLLGLETWDTSSVTNMCSMFENLGGADVVVNFSDISGWDTSQVTNMSAMFQSFPNLNVSLKNWDVSKVENMYRMFYYADITSDITVFDLSGWNTGNVTNMSGMFGNFFDSATNFNLNLSGWDTSKVIYMENMFDSSGSSNSTFWNVEGLSDWDVSNVDSMSGMFSNILCYMDTFELDLSNWNTSSLTSTMGMFENSFWNVNNLKIDLTGWDMSDVTYVFYMFSRMGFNSKSVSLYGLEYWNVSNVFNMSYMFENAGRNATELFIGDLSGWDTSKVIYMENMFYYMAPSADYNLDLSKWDVSKVTSRSYFSSGVSDKIISPIWN